jgi:hypothetical protein
MRGLGIALVLLALSYHGLAVFSPLSGLGAQTTVMLKFRHLNLDNALTSADRDMTLPEGGVAQLDQMRRDRLWTSLELRRRELRVGLWMPVLGVTGLGLVLLSMLTFLSGERKKDLGQRSEAEGAAVHVWPPRDVYSDEWEFGRQHEGSFVSRDEAIAWLKKDPLKQCEYCGGEMKPTAGGPREGIELVTFYKKVPEGARDLRVVLGSYWFVKAAPELKCEGCERVVRR